MTASATITPASLSVVPTHPTHPLGARARVLLTSVFGPYAQDDEYGSRTCNPMELYHNQVTRVQGPFSLRMFHRSWGIMLIHDSIDVASTLLDFPDLDRFIQAPVCLHRWPWISRNARLCAQRPRNPALLHDHPAAPCS